MAKKIIVTESQLKGIITESILNSVLSILGGQYTQPQIIKALRMLLSGNMSSSDMENNPEQKTLLDKIKQLLGWNKRQNQEQPMETTRNTTQTKAPATEPSRFCLNFITGFEADVPNSTYPCKKTKKELIGYVGLEDRKKAANGQPYHKTYGYGLKYTPDDTQFMDQLKSTFTSDELDKMFVEKVKIIGKNVLNHLKKNYGNVVLGQNQLDAIICACYNYGIKGFLVNNGMGKMIGANPNNPKIPEVWASLKSNNERRQAEAQLYAQDIPNYGQNDA